MSQSSRVPWKVSLHGGHSGQYCGHAQPCTLREVLDAAVAAGYHTFGVTEHAPRCQARFLYPEELELGWTEKTLADHFAAYAREVQALQEQYRERLAILRGFEIEVVPAGEYVKLMRRLRDTYRFQYIVGSVHYVDEILIDGALADFNRAVTHCGGLEAMAVRYYHAVAEMVDEMEPAVVAHLDLVRKNAPDEASVDSPAIRKAAGRALEAVAAHGAILDVNTAGYRKGLGRPYPAPWILQRARDMKIGVSFGDDSHGPADVGAGIEAARQYLLDNGIREITYLAQAGGRLVQETAPLEN